MVAGGRTRTTHTPRKFQTASSVSDEPPDVARGGIRRALSLSFLASISINAVNIVTGVLLARSLGLEDRGALAAVLLWPTLLGVIGSLGVPEAMTYHVARKVHQGSRIVGTGLLLAAGQSLIFVAVGAGLLPFVLTRQSDATVTTAYLFLADIPLTVVTLTIMGVLNGRRRYSWFHAIRVMLVACVLGPLIVLAVTGTLTVRTAVYAYLFAKLLTMTATIVLLVRSEPAVVGFRYDTARELLAYGIKSHASGVSTHLNQRFDQLVISIFLSPSRLGIYVVAVSLNGLGFLIGGSVAYVAFPAISALKTPETRMRAARRFVSLTLALSFAVCMPLIVLAPQIVDLLFGAGFHEAGDISRILLVSVVVFSMNRSIEAVLRAVGRPLDAGIAEIIAVTVSLTALAVLLPALGLVGAALSSVLAAAVSGAWMIRRAGRALGIRAHQVAAPPPGDVAAAARYARRLLRRTR